MSTASNIKKKIKKITDKLIDETLENMKVEIAYRIEEQFESCIQDFYNHYPEPAFYNRTLKTYEASDSSDRLSIAYSKGKNKVGIYVSADFIEGNPYHGKRANKEPVDKGWVFENTFVHGMHGYPPYEGKKAMRNPPEARMDSWFKDFKSNKGHVLDKIKDDAFTKALGSFGK